MPCHLVLRRLLVLPVGEPMKYAWELWLFLVPIVALITFYVWLSDHDG